MKLEQIYDQIKKKKVQELMSSLCLPTRSMKTILKVAERLRNAEVGFPC